MDRAKPAILLLLAFFLVPAAGAAVAPPLADPSSLAAVSGIEPGPTAVQSNLTVLADSTITSAYPTRNFGKETVLRLSADPSNGTTSRSLVRFDTSSIPSTAQILDATLWAYAQEASADLEVHRVLPPWLR